MLPSSGHSLNLNIEKMSVQQSIGIGPLTSFQLFDRISEQRCLNLRRLIRLGFDGRSSQINGILLRQSNIFQDFSEVNATQPRRDPSLENTFHSKTESGTCENTILYYYIG